MIDIEGTTLSPQDRELLQHPLVGGLILFSRNFHDIEQLRALINEVHELRSPRLLVAVDHEGGRVQRFREGFTRIPPMRRFGELYAKDKKRAKALAETCGWLLGSELRAEGVDFSFTPVLDLDYGVSEVIGDRAFHRDPEFVADLAHSLMQGMHYAGMMAVGKHFPGHGAVAADSHTEIPRDDRRYEDIYAEDILPFERMIHFGLAAIMPAHVIYSRVDELPAGFSPFWIQEVLRQRLGFQGVILSDDLSMEGASVIGDYLARTRAALTAGCDMALVCNNRAAVIEIVEGFDDYHNPVSQMRLVRMHGRFQTSRAELLQDSVWLDAVKQLNKLNEVVELQLNI
jgi:beta-N-acetylhexosaminidase